MSRLVSCIMPSKRGDKAVMDAVCRFYLQTYEQKELVIVVSDPHIVRNVFGNVRFVIVPYGLSIGELRNVAIRASYGSIIAHWDDDDISMVDRLKLSVECLDAGRQEVCHIDDHCEIVGSSRVIFKRRSTGETWLYDGKHCHPSIVGGTLVYNRSLWEDRKFQDVTVGEDTRWMASWSPGYFTDLNDESLYTAYIEDDATSPKDTNGIGWSKLNG